MLLFHLLHVDRREPELVQSACATFIVILLKSNSPNVTFCSVHFIPFFNLIWTKLFLKYDKIQFHRIVCKMLDRHIVTKTGLFYQPQQ